MRFPWHIVADQFRYQIGKALRRERRFPMVLMLEPLYTCNLACIGCSIERHTGRLQDRLTVAQCLAALDDCGAPTVSICGGEPTIYPELPELVAAIIARRKHIYLCTNALLLDKKVYGVIPPHRRLTINVHLDGMRTTHDYVCNREGVFDKAIAMIREGKRLGYHVMANCTVFKETDMDEVEQLCATLTELGVDGLLVAPGYEYESLAGRDIFLQLDDTHVKFQRVRELSRRYRLTSTPLYLDFAAGMIDLPCSPWSTVTYTPMGWKAPCYLIGQRFYATWEEFWHGVNWEYWESRKDIRCRNCKMHSGFEASAVRAATRSLRQSLRLLAWNLRG